MSQAKKFWRKFKHCIAHHYYHISNCFPRIAEERRSGVVVFIVRTFAGETLHSVEFWLNIMYKYYTWFGVDKTQVENIWFPLWCTPVQWINRTRLMNGYDLQIALARFGVEMFSTLVQKWYKKLIYCIQIISRYFEYLWYFMPFTVQKKLEKTVKIRVCLFCGSLKTRTIKDKTCFLKPFILSSLL